MSATDRVSQIAGHLNYPQGLLHGQTAIVTGAGQGIGAEIARLFVNEGARVIVSDIDSGMVGLHCLSKYEGLKCVLLEKAAAVARSLGERALAAKTDVLDTQDIENLVKKAAEFGGGKIHIIVNNAGFTWDAVLHKVSLSQPIYSLKAF